MSLAPKPFLKWAGGKRQLMTTLSANFPRRFERYFEPFLGGGAVLFYLLSWRRPERCLVSDINCDLITAYIVIRDNVEELITSLKEHSRRYYTDRSSYYYHVRETEPDDPVLRCARLIFLNRTCFNGLYRVNSKGKFNVPIGKYARPSIVNEENLRRINRLIHHCNVTIQCRDFSSILEEVQEEDFVYMDPPYMPVSKTASFTGYTDSNFTYGDLQRLVKVCSSLDEKKCHVLFSNSNTERVSELFDERWTIQSVSANRNINSKHSKRRGHTELLIKNF